MDTEDSDLFSSLPVSESNEKKLASRSLSDDNGNEDLFADASDTQNDADDDHELNNANPVVQVEAPSATNNLAGDTEDVLPTEDLSRQIEIMVSDPKKVGDGMSAYVTYKVTTHTNIKHFKKPEMTVIRRFSDFLGLHDKLVAKYQPTGVIIPPPPEKSVLGMTKVKMMKEESGSLDFVEKRRAALERFLNRVARHPQLCSDGEFIDFVELDGDLPKSTSTSALSGAGFVRLLNKVGDSIGKMTYTMVEPDEWFEDKAEQIELMDREFQQLHASIELLVLNRRDLALNTEQLAKSVAILGTAEEHMSLSRALSHLSEVETKIHQLHIDQSDADFFVLSELVKDYITVVQAIKDVFHERVKVHKTWKDAESALLKKQEDLKKFEQQQKSDKVAATNVEINELKTKVENGERDFDEISRTIRRELGRFDQQRIRDFRATIINYLQCMMNYQQQVVACWEHFLPEAKDVASA